MNLNKSVLASFIGLALSTTSMSSLATSLNAPQKIKLPVNTFAQINTDNISVSGMSNLLRCELSENSEPYSSRSYCLFLCCTLQ